MVRASRLLFGVVLAACRPAPVGGDALPPAPVAGAEAPASNEVAPGMLGGLSEPEFKALHQRSEGQPPQLHGDSIDVAGSQGYLSLPQGSPPFPAVLVIHEWWGLTDHIRHWADRLAADGYAALAIDLYGGKTATTPDEAMTLMKAVEQQRALEILAAGHQLLGSEPRVSASSRGVIGWCFGGGWSLQHALATADLDAAVMYYGRTEADPKALAPLKAPLLGVFANRDKAINLASVAAFEKALTESGKTSKILRYEADHAFANPSSARYDETAAAAAWDEVRAFLARELK